MPAQKTEQVAVDGQIVKVERQKGSFTADDGAIVPWDYDEVRVLTAGYDVNVVRFPRDVADGSHLVAVPEIGTHVHLLCDARNASGNIRLTLKSVVGPSYEQLREAVREYEALAAA